jgi:putative transposase
LNLGSTCRCYSDHLAANDIVASVGSKGDSYDNALAESFNGLYKWELIYPNGPWVGLEDVEWATLTYVDWFNHRRLHGEITNGPGYTTPAAFGPTTTVRSPQPPRPELNNHSLHENPGRLRLPSSPLARRIVG